MIISENDRCYEIRQKASKLLRELDIDTSTAIDIRNIIASLEKPISLKFIDLKGIPGFTCFDKNKNRYRIFLDDNLIDLCPARLKFTIAHELGHIILDHFIIYNNSLDMNLIMEREANTFVDELLMPTYFILWNRIKAKEIVERYEVSTAAANNKILYLKANALYKQIQAEINAKRFINRNIRNVEYSDYNNTMVNKLRDAWLDPDYDFGGF